jgi:hypothetical protein
MNFSLAEIAPYIVVIVIVLINIALWASIRSRSTQDQFDLLGKAGKSIRKPWEKEDKAIQELSEKVRQFKTNKDDIQKDNED